MNLLVLLARSGLDSMLYHIFKKLKTHLTHHYLVEGELMCVSVVQIKSKEIQAELFRFTSTTARGSLQA